MVERFAGSARRQRRGMVIGVLTLAVARVTVAAHAELSPQAAEQARQVIATMQNIADAESVQKLAAIEIGGVRQWVSIRGRNRHNPVLLFIHDGPGSPMMPLSWTYQQPWEDYFTVVQWDQRGAGKTYLANDPKTVAPTMTVAQMVSDTAELVAYLRKEFGQQKIFVMGHSRGTILGVKLAQEHPDWLYAYIGVGQVVNMRKSESQGYSKLLAQATSAKNEAALRELRALAPYPGSSGPVPLEKVVVDRKWVVQFGGMTHAGTDALQSEIMKLSPQYTYADVEHGEEGTLFTLSAAGIWQAAVDIEFESIRQFKCPVVFFVGRHDLAVSPELVAAWYETLQAPSKALFWFERSAHYVVSEEPGLALGHLINDVLPLASPH